MTELAAKERLLKDAGYWYKPDRELYINRKVRKAFSIDFLQDHAPDEIASKIQETTLATEWTFVFNARPSDSVKRELTRMLDGQSQP